MKQIDGSEPREIGFGREKSVDKQRNLIGAKLNSLTWLKSMTPTRCSQCLKMVPPIFLMLRSCTVVLAYVPSLFDNSVVLIPSSFVCSRASRGSCRCQLKQRLRGSGFTYKQDHGPCERGSDHLQSYCTSRGTLQRKLCKANRWAWQKGNRSRSRKICRQAKELGVKLNCLTWLKINDSSTRLVGLKNSTANIRTKNNLDAASVTSGGPISLDNSVVLRPSCSARSLQ